MNNFVLLDAISFLDIDLLQKHLVKKAKQKERINHMKRTRIVKWVALAACACLIIAVSFISIPFFQKFNLEGQMKYYFEGTSVEKKIGKLIFDDVDSSKQLCSFTLMKVDDTPIYFKFGGYIVKETWVDEHGVERQKSQQIDVITPYGNYKPDNGHEILDVDLVITVNGDIVDAIPSEAGVYKITIDYSELYDVLDHVDDTIEVSKFGYFYLGASDITN